MNRKSSALLHHEKNMLEFIQQYINTHGYAPSVRDLQTGLGISSTSVANHRLQCLANKGYIERSANVARGIRLLSEAQS